MVNVDGQYCTITYSLATTVCLPPTYNKTTNRSIDQAVLIFALNPDPSESCGCSAISSCGWPRKLGDLRCMCGSPITDNVAQIPYAHTVCTLDPMVGRILEWIYA